MEHYLLHFEHACEQSDCWVSLYTTFLWCHQIPRSTIDIIISTTCIDRYIIDIIDPLIMIGWLVNEEARRNVTEIKTSWLNKKPRLFNDRGRASLGSYHTRGVDGHMALQPHARDVPAWWPAVGLSRNTDGPKLEPRTPRLSTSEALEHKDSTTT